MGPIKISLFNYVVTYQGIEVPLIITKPILNTDIK